MKTKEQETMLMIRRLTIQDIDKMAQLCALVLEEKEKKEEFYATSQEEWKSFFMRKGAIVLGCLEETKDLLAGFAAFVDEPENGDEDSCRASSYLPFSCEGMRVLTLDTIAVHPAYRGQGLSACLCTKIFHELEKTALPCVILSTVHPSNMASAKVMAGLGFKKAAFAKDYYGIGYDRNIWYLVLKA